MCNAINHPAGRKKDDESYTNNYNQSKCCLIELGYAYARSISNKKKYHILPFCIPPITWSEALLGTPLAHLNTALLNDQEDLGNFLRILIKNNLILESSIMNCDIPGFINRINNEVMKTENILGNAVIWPLCSMLDNQEVIKHTQDNDKHTINFNLFANGKVNARIS